MYIRQDWLDKLNLSMPTDTESFRAMLQAFVTGDPNGNGTNDELGITGGTQSQTPVQWILMGHAFVTCRPNFWLYLDETTKQVTFAPAQEAYRKGLTYIKSLYDEGLIDPAAFTNTNAQLQVTVRTEPYIAGAYVCDHAAMGVDTNNYDEYKNYQVLPTPLKGPDGFQEQPSNNNFGEIGSFALAITDQCENVDAAFRLADYFLSEEQTVRTWLGKEGRNWELIDGSSNLKTVLGEPAKYKKITGYEGSDKDERYRTLSIPYFKSLAINNSAMLAVEDVYEPSWYEQRIMLDTVSLAEYRRDVYLPLNIFISQENNEAYNEVQTNLNDFVQKTAVQFILGERNLETDWENYLSELERYGADRYVEIYSEAYAAVNG